MKTNNLAPIAISLALFACTSFADAETHLLPDRVYRAAQERVDAGYYPALVIGYVSGDKSEVDVFGKLDNGKAVDADTVFEIGSITKTFTATLLAEEVQRGALKLDAPLATLLPDFAIPSRNDKKITLLDIATQTSGLPRLPSNLKPAVPTDPYADYGAAELKTFLSGYTLPRDPGESYEYSNLGFGLLGFALAQHEHSTYRELLQKDVLHPLGMTMTDVITTPAMREHLAAGHDGDRHAVPSWNFDAVAGAGAIRSTGNDMLRYLKANMGVTKTALAPAMNLAHEPRRDIGKDARIGLAWMTKSAKPHDVIWHNGATAGYVSMSGFTGDGQRGVVVLANIATSPEELGFAALLDDAPISETQNYKTVAMDVSALRDYIGIYNLSDSMLLTIAEQDDQLFAQATGQGPFPIYPRAKNEFFAKVGDISLTFQRDTKDKVSGLILHQHGDRNAAKLGAADAAAANKGVALDAETLNGYVGKYRLGLDAVFDFTIKDCQAYMALTGQPSFPIFARAKDKFFYTVVDAQLDFERNDKGSVVAVVLHQNGQDQRAPLIKPR